VVGSSLMQITVEATGEKFNDFNTRNNQLEAFTRFL
jgi:hypothetical protein